MQYRPTREQCLALLEKYGITKDAHETELIAVIKEAYHAGINAEVMKIKYKEVKDEQPRN